MSEAAREHERSAVLGVPHYVAVWIALILLAIASYAISRAQLPGAWPLGIALLIATVKGSLVLLFFMHLWAHRGPSRLALTVAFAFVALLISLTVADIATRFPVALPPEAPRARIHLFAEPPPPWSGVQRLEPQAQPHYK